jgi:MFS family permease
MVLYGYDASVFNALQNSDHWKAYYNEPGPNIIGAINTSYTVGAVVAGFFMGGPLADWAGRRIGMAAGSILVIIATFMQCFAPRGQIGIFIAGRVIIGIGQGLALTAGSIYIGELAPSEIRGKIMSFWQMFYSVGSFLAYWVSFGTSKHPQKLGEWDWKMVVIFQLLMPVCILSQVFFIPESPRWYVQKSRNYEKARKSLRRVRNTEEEVEEEITTIREAIEFEAESISSGYSALWKDKSIRKRMYIAMIINGGQQITGQGTLNSYSSIIYKKVFPSADTVALINALNATFGIIFTLNATWTVDRFGRKFLFIVGGIGMAACMIVAATVETQTPSLPNGAKTQPVGIAIVFVMFLFAFFCKSCYPPPRKTMTNNNHRQAIMGRHCMDLHRRDLLYERPRPGRRHVLANTKRRQLYCPAVLPPLPPERRLLRILHVRRHQPPACRLHLVLCTRDQEGYPRGDGCRFWWCQPR